MLKSLLIIRLQQSYLSIPYHPIVVQFMKFCHWLPQELKVSLLRNPLNILKLGNFFFMMKENKIVALEIKDLPIVINADGCSTNISAGDKLLKLFGLLTPTIQCIAHAVDGSLKWLANSNECAGSYWFCSIFLKSKSTKVSAKTC